MSGRLYTLVLQQVQTQLYTGLAGQTSLMSSAYQVPWARQCHAALAWAVCMLVCQVDVQVMHQVSQASVAQMEADHICQLHAAMQTEPVHMSARAVESVWVHYMQV